MKVLCPVPNQNSVQVLCPVPNQNSVQVLCPVPATMRLLVKEPIFRICLVLICNHDAPFVVHLSNHIEMPQTMCSCQHYLWCNIRLAIKLTVGTSVCPCFSIYARSSLYLVSQASSHFVSNTLVSHSNSRDSSFSHLSFFSLPSR